MVAVGRRRLRFSLRTLFVLVTIAACWCGYHANRAVRQRRAVEMVRAYDGRVVYRHQLITASRWDLSREPDTWAPSWLRKWLGDDWFAEVVHVDLRASSRRSKFNHPPTNDEVKLLGNLTALEYLLIADIPITDDVVHELRGLNNVVYFCLIGTNVTDASMATIGRFKNLQTLCVDRRTPTIEALPITGRGLRELAGLEQLEYLWVQGTLVDDDALRHLATCRKLMLLDLSRTRVTTGGLRHLAQLPLLNCVYLCNGDRESLEDALGGQWQVKTMSNSTQIFKRMAEPEG